MTYKEIFVPFGKHKISALKSWTVSWNSFYGSVRYPDGKRENEVFTEEDVAKDFAVSLKEAFKFLRCDVDILGIKITENKEL
jgi:hypothetical protein